MSNEILYNRRERLALWIAPLLKSKIDYMAGLLGQRDQVIEAQQQMLGHASGARESLHRNLEQLYSDTAPSMSAFTRNKWAAALGLPQTALPEGPTFPGARRGTDVMLDLETLGTTPGHRVLSIGAVEFTPFGPAREFYLALDQEQQEQVGLLSDPATEQWWSEQSPEARTVLSEPKTATNVALQQFDSFLRSCGTPKEVRVWGNGAGFDQPILTEVYKRIGLGCPWLFYNERCFRTLKQLPKAPEPPERKGVHHNALDDARYQAEHATRILNTLELWE